MKKLLLSLMFLLPMLGNAAKKPYSLTWNDFNIKDDTGLMVLGQINTLTPAIDMDSRWSIGCECLDRIMLISTVSGIFMAGSVPDMPVCSQAGPDARRRKVYMISHGWTESWTD